jgi:hypothetical protein
VVKIYLLLVCTLHHEIFSLGEVIGTVPAWEEGESFPCVIIFFGGRVFLLLGLGWKVYLVPRLDGKVYVVPWIIVTVFLLGKGRVYPLLGLVWIIGTVPAWEGRESFQCLIIRLDNCCRFTFWWGESFPSARI